jgi:hypothetical protein
VVLPAFRAQAFGHSALFPMVLVGGILLLGLLVLWIPAILLAIAIICLTCCVALLPYLNSVALLPISVFFRCDSLCFLEQFGKDWRIVETEPAT